MSYQDTQLPQGLPSRLTGPLVEFGSAHPDVFVVDLDAADSQAIEEALASFKALGIDDHGISKDNFRLPHGLCGKLHQATLAVHHGCGVCLIRGLDPALHSDEDNLLLFLGLANYIGEKQGVQDKKGNVITHITDSKTWTAPYEQRHGVHTNKPLSWHCDMGADILALQVRQVAAKGGATMVSSSWRIYNDLVAERPDVVHVLAQPDWPVHVSDRKSRYTLAPLMAFEENRLLVNFDPSRLGRPPAAKGKLSSRAEAIPQLTDKQLDALSVLSMVAERHRVHLDTKRGDLVFINNWAILHARTAYVDADGEAAVTRRHLLRLWLRNADLGWTVPESLRAPWEEAFGYADEGYVSGDHTPPTAQLKYAVAPEQAYKPARYASGSAAFVFDDSDSEHDEE